MTDVVPTQVVGAADSAARGASVRPAGRRRRPEAAAARTWVRLRRWRATMPVASRLAKARSRRSLSVGMGQVGLAREAIELGAVRLPQYGQAPGRQGGQAEVQVQERAARGVGDQFDQRA